MCQDPAERVVVHQDRSSLQAQLWINIGSRIGLKIICPCPTEFPAIIYLRIEQCRTTPEAGGIIGLSLSVWGRSSAESSHANSPLMLTHIRKASVR